VSGSDAVIRYLRLYAHFLRFSFSRAMQFRLDFFFRVGMDTFWYAMHLVLFDVLYRHTDRLGGWNRDETYLFLGGVFVADALQMTLVSNNLWQFTLAVNKGDLDYHLVRPVSTLFFVSLRDFAANSFLNLLIAVGILVWAIARYPGDLPATTIAVYVPMLLAGGFIHYCLQLGFLLPVFWTHSGTGLRDVFWTMDTYTSRPAGIFRGWVRRVLVSVLPLALVVSYPTRILVEGPSWEVVLHVTGVAVGAFLVLLWIWKRGLRAYASASS
jgi:ABC-2 type transport system permease protein